MEQKKRALEKKRKGVSSKIGSVFNRLLSKLASVDEVPGADGAQRRSVHEVLDRASTGATQQFATEVEFGKKSNTCSPNTAG